MTIEIQQLERKFKYDSVMLPDPNPAFTIAQVRDFFASSRPDILNAEIEGPTVDGNVHTYTFRRAVGTKGNAFIRTGEAIRERAVPAVPRRKIEDLLALAQIGWLDAGDADFIKMLHIRGHARAPRYSRAELTRFKQLHETHCSMSAPS